MSVESVQPPQWVMHNSPSSFYHRRAEICITLVALLALALIVKGCRLPPTHSAGGYMLGSGIGLALLGWVVFSLRYALKKPYVVKIASWNITRKLSGDSDTDSNLTLKVGRGSIDDSRLHLFNPLKAEGYGIICFQGRNFDKQEGSGYIDFLLRNEYTYNCNVWGNEEVGNGDLTAVLWNHSQYQLLGYKAEKNSTTVLLYDVAARKTLCIASVLDTEVTRAIGERESDIAICAGAFTFPRTTIGFQTDTRDRASTSSDSGKSNYIFVSSHVRSIIGEQPIGQHWLNQYPHIPTAATITL